MQVPTVAVQHSCIVRGADEKQGRRGITLDGGLCGPLKTSLSKAFAIYSPPIMDTFLLFP